MQQACQNGSFDYNVLTLADFMAGDVYQSTIVRGNEERQVFLNSFTLFAQDAWQTTRKLNLNYGLRYDYEGPLHTNYADVSVFDPSKGGLVVAGAGISSLYPKIWTNLSPCLGLAFQLKEDGDLVIRAGFGLFFDTPAIVPFLDNSSSLAAASTANNGPIGVEGNPPASIPFTPSRRMHTPFSPMFHSSPTEIFLSPAAMSSIFSPSVRTSAPRTI